jgi:uncharacterized tellurite resistance protein B-like protein
MLAALKHFLGRPTAERPRVDAKLAIAQLLLEMARADFSADASEIATIRELLGRAFGLGSDDLEALLKEAGQHLARSISLHEAVAAINATLGAEERAKLVAMLWRVAYADGVLDKYEEALLRKLCDLLFVPHSTFIREKLAVGRPGARDE